MKYTMEPRLVLIHHQDISIGEIGRILEEKLLRSLLHRTCITTRLPGVLDASRGGSHIVATRIIFLVPAKFVGHSFECILQIRMDRRRFLLPRIEIFSI